MLASHQALHCGNLNILPKPVWQHGHVSSTAGAAADCCWALLLLLLLLQDVAPPLDEISRFNQAGQSGDMEDLTVSYGMCSTVQFYSYSSKPYLSASAAHLTLWGGGN
jgi:hypothetical protein